MDSYQIGILTLLLAIFIYLLIFDRKSKSIHNHTSNQSNDPANHNNANNPSQAATVQFIHLNLLQLKSYNGITHPSTYIAIKNLIYDVSWDSKFYIDRGLAGQDLTRLVAKNDYENLSELNKDCDSLKGLTFDELQALESAINFVYNQKYKVIGYLDYDNTNNSNNKSRNNINAIDNNDELHTAIDNDDLQSVQSILSQSNVSKLINQPCKRTFMTPLHKAVEHRNLAIVRELVSKGADLMSKAMLYDNETALELAQRFEASDIIHFLQSVAQSDKSD